MKMDLDRGPDQEALGVFQKTLQGDDRGFCADFTEAQEQNWPKLSFQSPEIVVQDYEDLPDLNPITSMVRTMVARTVKEVEDKGIPLILFYNGFKASLIAGAAYAAADGGIEEKNHAANVAAKALLVASPTLYVACGLAAVKVVKFTLKVAKKVGNFTVSPKP